MNAKDPLHIAPAQPDEDAADAAWLEQHLPRLAGPTDPLVRTTVAGAMVRMQSRAMASRAATSALFVGLAMGVAATLLVVNLGPWAAAPTPTGHRVDAASASLPEEESEGLYATVPDFFDDEDTLAFDDEDAEPWDVPDAERADVADAWLPPALGGGLDDLSDDELEALEDALRADPWMG